MPTVAEARPARAWLVDTSVAVPLLLVDHDQHADVASAVGDRRLGLAGHAAFETCSVLTRLPAPLRRTPAAVVRLLDESFPGTVHLGSERSTTLLIDLAERRVAGGSVYDAMVAACAIQHGLTLITRDRRAMSTYRALSAETEVVD